MCQICGRLAVKLSEHCPCIHRGYLCVIFVRTFSVVTSTGLIMIMASHQTFSGQIKHMSSQIKFGQTNYLYIINGNFTEFAKENECPDNFHSLS